jgi:hypothetical protein
MMAQGRSRVALGVALAVTALLGVVGLAHTPTFSALYAQATGETCPFGGKAAVLSAKDLDAQMRAADAHLRGAREAAEKPALGFGLLTTKRDAFETWAYASGGHCYSRDQGLTLECAELPLSKLPHAFDNTRGTVWARFDTSDRLREVTAISRARDSSEAALMFNALAEHLTTRVGPPHAQHGEASAAYLARGGLIQSAAEYRFADYYAKVSATNMGSADGFRIVQKYRALAD